MLPAVPADRESLDVIIIGAGQAGLALGHHLGRRGARFLLLDAAPEIGHSWRQRWDSLRLFSPAQYDSLPGMPFPAAADTHPGKDDVADYLASYAARFELPVRLNTPVQRLQRENDAFAVTTAAGRLHATQVVVATGPFQAPYIPGIAEQLDPLVPQLHSARLPQPRPAARRGPGAGRRSGQLRAPDRCRARADPHRHRRRRFQAGRAAATDSRT